MSPPAETPEGTAMTTAVRLRGLRKAFRAKTVLDGVDLDIPRGAFTVLLGPSGTGKTTLLRILAGLEEPDAGEVLVPRRRTTVYQEPRLIPARRVLANVTLGRRRGPATRAAGERALDEVGLADKARAWPATLSGGEAQRVALARALVREPELLLLDEPFAALDALTRLRTQDLVAELCARHRPAVLLVTHDVDEAVRLADRVLILRGGRIALDRELAEDHPRHRDDPDVLALRRDLLAELGVPAAH
ncbi:ABC transporter ATP-binding protein [Nocardiopsis sp. MT53]|uniref:ABC transporter ATP-binding protein n=2 Tax=Nocardiopsidaceae TaxID=83676 RepID=A0ABX8BJP6_9ACTN|nr:ABC transporter ATP-binding protein [Nocardiopsis changdeensis]QYX36973.1 ABC transporter ATP-binding protein [Nocardiopsis sp. MT53]